MTNDLSRGLDDSGDTSATRDRILQLPATVVQAIYFEVTGKTENISFTRSKAFQISLSDLEQLHSKFLQFLEQYNVTGPKTKIIVSYFDDNNVTFRDFYKFKLLTEPGKVEPVNNIEIQYEFLISSPRVEEYSEGPLFHRYKVTLNLLSQCANVDKKNRFFGFFGPPPLFCQIEYVDFLIANNIKNFLNDWHQALTDTEFPYDFNFLRSVSHKFAFLSIIISLLFSMASVYMLLGFFPEVKQGSLQAFAHWLISALSLVFLMVLLVKLLSDVLEYSVDHIQKHSAILLNKGDQQCYDKVLRVHKQYFSQFIGSVFSIVFILLMNLLSNFFYDRIFH